MPVMLKQWFNRWLNQRIPAAEQQTLSHRSIFILPSGFGLLWIMLVVLLFLFGTNYQNNLVIGMALLLASIFVSTILHSYRNLAGLTVISAGTAHTYAGQQLSIPLKLSAERPLFQLQLSFQPENPLRVAEVTAEPQQRVVALQTDHRGRLNPGRLRIESRYPLGLCRVWSWLDLNTHHIVFPTHARGQQPLSRLDDDMGSTGKQLSGVEEYAGLRNYIPGESLKQVAWKQWAQERGMLSKEFTTPAGEPVWLTLAANLNQQQLEQQLSLLCYQVDELAKQPNQYWGLALGPLRIAPNQGQAHRLQCLTALACYQQERL
ncbi:DUF58 domain-containing protein [Shewanella sp. C32]|uniref:DUF58 domain-containing protein n=1 Tax=Shewanella electrica TaxID=515560 RepID=A0ABT2FPW4_9GAMM|nr:DUF58 domain-containing protein [Shewanella electrica]MCH1926824.1 DUF58 domain-containing protein [Shewanella electrica]MCS4558385.1 DUF58 domain-containing protein [Shewanella electrica]